MIDQIRGAYFVKDRTLLNSTEFTYTLEAKNVYEVIRIMEGKPLFLREHLDRMKSSLGLQSMPLSKSQEEIRNLIEILVKKNEFKEGNIKLLLNGINPTVLYLYFIPHYYPEAKLYQQGIVTKTLKIERNNPNAKVIDPAYKKAVVEFIENEEIYEALIVNQKSEITEGSKSNAFFVKDGSLITPPLKDVLGGVTRHKIIELAKKHSINVLEAPLRVEDIPSLEAAFISGTSPSILPIRKINDTDLASSTNPVIIKLIEVFKGTVKEEINHNL